MLLAKIPGFENELSDFVAHHLGVLDTLVPDILIPRQQNPSLLAYEREPFMVGRAAAEMAKVSFVSNTVLEESF